jgi:hypothetical protein
MNNDKLWEVPPLRDEIDRKTLETYQWLIDMSVDGQIAESEVKVGVQAIFGVTAGLVSEKVKDFASVVEANPFAKQTQRRVFYSPIKTFVVTWTVGDDTVRVQSISSEGVKAQDYKKDNSREALMIFAALCEHMKVYGCKELL